MLRTQGTSEPPFASPHTPLPPARSKGTLSISENGHVRFVPSSHGHSGDAAQVDPQQTIVGSIDLSSGPFPFGRQRIDIGELIAALPSRQYCMHLKDVYFKSFAPVGPRHHNHVVS